MSSTNQGPRRVGQWLYLRPESIDEYKKCHAAVWPEVLEQIKDSNIRDCTSAALPFLFSTQHPLHLKSDEMI
jgi:L-rhamnose mutarotase